MKCGLAAILGAVKSLKDAGLQPAGDLYVAGAADEEYLSIGSEQLAKAYRVDGVIVAEPSGFYLVTAHKGFIWFEVETFGRAAHAATMKTAWMPSPAWGASWSSWKSWRSVSRTVPLPRWWDRPRCTPRSLRRRRVEHISAVLQAQD